MDTPLPAVEPALPPPVGPDNPLATATIRQLLHDVHAAVETMNRIKAVAKKLIDPGNHHVPNEAALSIYYLAIGVARLRLGARITTIPDDALCTGLGWTQGHAWIDSPTRQLAQRCLTPLHGMSDQTHDRKKPAPTKPGFWQRLTASKRK